MYLTITGAAAALPACETTSVALTEAALAVADAHDETAGAYLARFDETALAAAAKADAELAAGAAPRISVRVKDVITMWT